MLPLVVTTVVTTRWLSLETGADVTEELFFPSDDEAAYEEVCRDDAEVTAADEPD